MTSFLPHGLGSIEICNLLPEVCNCFVVRTSALLEDDRNEFFKSTDNVEFVDENADVLDLLVRAKVFPSKGQARKNWHGPVEIPKGWTETVTSKGRNRRFLFVWKP